MDIVVEADCGLHPTHLFDNPDNATVQTNSLSFVQFVRCCESEAIDDLPSKIFASKGDNEGAGRTKGKHGLDSEPQRHIQPIQQKEPCKSVESGIKDVVRNPCSTEVIHRPMDCFANQILFEDLDSSSSPDAVSHLGKYPT